MAAEAEPLSVITRSTVTPSVANQAIDRVVREGERAVLPFVGQAGQRRCPAVQAKREASSTQTCRTPSRRRGHVGRGHR
jgi:hypothetical protein